MDLNHLTWLAAYAATLLGAAWWDTAQRRIPNALVLAGAAIALAIASLPGGIGLAASLSGLAAGLAIGFPFYVMRLAGAGDAKLFAAAGAFVGFPRVMGVLLLTMIAGGALSIVYAFARGKLAKVLANVNEGVRTGLVVCVAERRLPSAADFPVVDDRLPYAVAIAIGALGQLAISASPL